VKYACLSGASRPTRRALRSCSATWVLFAALLCAGSVYADPIETSTGDWLEWNTTSDTCPDAEAFVAKVEEHLGRSPALAAAESRHRLVARIEQEATAPSRWSAVVYVLDLSGNVIGSRTIAKTSDSCGPVADALALVSALVFSQQALADAKTPQVQSPSPKVVTTAIAPVLSLEVPSVTPAQPRWSIAVDGGLALGIGSLPGLNLGGEARLLLALPAWPVLYARFVLWSEATKTIAADRGATLDLWTAGLGACPVYHHLPSWALALCAGGDLERLHAHGFGFASKASGEQWRMELTAGGQVQHKLVGGLSAAIGLELVIPLMHERIAYEGSAGEPVEVWQSWPIAGTGSLRLVYAFW